eukprot:comp19706_c0_seq1/m.23448 comp19706_c0_seq1/g.23448  ORF comp19706_c0_seq1/g.23448 comp19706_c0_seq1/m.23448 type:complete len:315 (-) comp19706_c0_seq1:11-955(-)
MSAHKRGYEGEEEPGAKRQRGEGAETKQLVEAHYNSRPDKGLEARQQSVILQLRSFNNWVKSLLINQYVRPGDTVLDLCCGKGGDLLKYSKRRVGRLVGVDLADVSIQQARQRYAELRGFRPPADFYTADCGTVRLRDMFPERYAFDVVSCQFSLHYAFESEQRARRMLQNITDLLKPGGYFIGTTPDACRLVKKVKSVEGLEFGNDVFKASFVNRDSFPVYGCKYLFTLVDAIDTCPEFLVHFHHLEGLAREYGLELLLHQRFHEFYQEAVREPTNVDLMVRMRVFDQNGTIDRHQWEAIGYYVLFAFQKKKN